MTGRAPYTREQFAAAMALGRESERRAGRLLAAVAVVPGFAQLVLLKWADARLEKSRATAIAGAAFIIYAVAVAWTLRTFLARRTVGRPACPACARTFDDTGLRIVIASGHCDGCGAQVID